MIQCCDCEFGQAMPDGHINMTCDTGKNIKEPECLLKWQMVSLCGIERAVTNLERQQAEMMPATQKIIQHNVDQIAEQQAADDWKRSGEEDDGDLD